MPICEIWVDYLINIVYHSLAHLSITLLNNAILCCTERLMKIMIGFRVSNAFKELLEKLAEEENRSLSSFMYNAIMHYIRNVKGVDWKEPSKKS